MKRAGLVSLITIYGRLDVMNIDIGALTALDEDVAREAGEST